MNNQLTDHRFVRRKRKEKVSSKNDRIYSSIILDIDRYCDSSVQRQPNILGQLVSHICLESQFIVSRLNLQYNSCRQLTEKNETSDIAATRFLFKVT